MDNEKNDEYYINDFHEDTESDSINVEEENCSKSAFENKVILGKNSDINYHISTGILSVLIFSICILISNTSISEIVDLELPLILILTLILSQSSVQGYFKKVTVVYLIIIVITYLINPTYTFFFVVSLVSNLLVKCIIKIYYNEDDLRYNKNITAKDIIAKHLKRVRYHLLLSAILFVTFLLLGYIYPSVFQEVLLPSLQGLSEGVQQGTIKLETISLFQNNFSVALNMIFGGVYLSISSIYLLIFNALIVGYSGSSMNLAYYLAYTLPHGIVELSAIIVAGAAAFRITDAILFLLSGIKLNENNKEEIFFERAEISIKMIYDVIIMIVVISLLLLIAAYIEANLTIPIGQMIIN